MSKIKKIICLLLSVIMLLSFNVPVLANDNTQNTINSLSTTEITEQLQITVSTDKYSYRVSNVATIYVSVKNVSDKTLKNVKAQVVFDDLQPVSVRKSTTSLEIAELEAGESFDFSYKATLNINKHDLSIFQKIFLWIVRLFNGGYTATNNSIDVVAENVTDIIFGKFTAKNVIQVGYERNTTSNDSIEEQIKQTEYVQNSIDDFCNSNEYKSSNSEEQISLMKSFLNDLEKNGEIKNIIFEDRWVTFEFKNGWGGGIELVDSHAEDCFQSSTSSAYIDDTRYATEILTLSENTYSNKFDKWTFSVGTTDSCYSMQELANQYSALGLSIERKELATVQTYKEFSGSEFIYIQSHGDTKNGIPVIKSEEFVTKETEKLYADSLNQGDIKIWGNAKTNTWYFYIYPSFFENNYKNNELNDAIVYIGSCNAFGNNNIENHSFYESFKKAGASTVIGFCNSVNVGYSNYFAERLLSYLSLGYSIGESFNEAVNVLGENGNIFWEQYGEPDIRKDDEYPAYPIIRGETNVTLFDKQIEGLGTFTATISDDNTNNPIENVAVEIKSIANTELYHLLKTNSNGTFSIYLPEGNYTCELIHKDYVRKEFEFSVEADNNIVILNSYYLTPKTYLMGTVIDKETNNPVEDASVLLQKIDEAGMIVGEYTCSTNKDGKFEISVPVGNYTYTINKLDMLNELYETATGTVTVSNVTGNVLATVYLSPKGNSGDDNTGDSGDTEERTVIDSGNCGADGDNVTWTLYEEGELVISGSGEMEDYEYELYTSTAPWSEKNVTSVIIEEGITNIGNYSFCCNSYGYGPNIVNISVPSTVKIIGVHAFDNSKLSQITISDGVTIIGNSAFANCDNLTIVILPNSITTIEDSAFSNCDNLTSVTFGKSTSYIGDYAFWKCYSLAELKNTENISFLGMDPFYDTKWYENQPFGIIYVGTVCYRNKWNSSYKTTDVVLKEDTTSIAERAFYQDYDIETIILNDGLKSIGDYAFSENDIVEIYIPSSVEHIGYCAFTENPIKSILVDENNQYYSSDNVGVLFDKCKTVILQYPNASENTSYNIPSSVNRIEGYAFSNSFYLSEITMSDSVSYIGYGAFENCSRLSEMILSNNVSHINNYTFSHCSSLRQITLSKSIKEIAQYAFNGCTSLTDAYYTGTQEEWDAIDIDINNESLTNATIHYNS